MDYGRKLWGSFVIPEDASDSIGLDCRYRPPHGFVELMESKVDVYRGDAVRVINPLVKKFIQITNKQENEKMENGKMAYAQSLDEDYHQSCVDDMITTLDRLTLSNAANDEKIRNIYTEAKKRGYDISEMKDIIYNRMYQRKEEKQQRDKIIKSAKSK